MLKPWKAWAASTRLGLFIVVLAAVLLLMVIGLVIANESLSRSDERQVAMDATASAAMAAQRLELIGEGLRRIHMMDDDSGAVQDQLGQLLSSLQGRRGVQAVWMLDPKGMDTRGLATTADPGLTRSGLEASRVVAHGGAAARELSVHALPPGGHNARRFVLVVQPVFSRDSILGIGVALVGADALLAPARGETAVTRSYAALVIRDDTVAHSGQLEGEGAQRTATSRVPVPGAEDWRVVVGHETSERGARSIFWVLGGCAFAFLLAGLVRERRQAIRITERSTELERLSAELLRANRMKSEFLANVSHELRTPLNAIVGFVDLLKDGAYGELSGRQVQPVDRIAVSAGHLRQLVDQILDIAKIAAGRMDVHLESVQVRPFVLNVVSEVEPLVTERSLAISIAVPASLPRIRTDPTHLRQILINLLANAIKYTPSGSIQVRARVTDDGTPMRSMTITGQHPVMAAGRPTSWIALQVVDTGIGIAAEDQERIFNEFEQVNAGPRGNSAERGTGLGLAISRRLAFLLGGDITVESELGKGSTFTAWLPMNAEESAVPRSPAQQDAQGSPLLSAAEN
jgi:signal transduction histidine kinase